MKDLWEVLEYVGEAFVFIGVVGEIVAEWREPYRLRLGRVSSLILIVGLAVSLAALIGTNEYFNGTIAKLNARSARLNQQAGEAQRDAANARKETAGLQKETQALKTEADNAKRDMVEAQLELARINGPPYIVPVSKDGVARPNLSKGNKQFVLLHRDTKIIFPLMPKGKSLAWTLFIVQDKTGGHQFSFSPRLNWPGNKVVFDSCVADIVTTDAQTLDRTLGGAVCTMRSNAMLSKSD